MKRQIRFIQRRFPVLNPVLNLAGQAIGIITFGSPAPFLKTNIAFALVPNQAAATSEDDLVQVCQNQVRAKQVPPPFCKSPKT
jgi:aminomethyltransferase